MDTLACIPYFRKLYGCKICLMVCPLNSRGIFKDGFREVAKDIRAAKDGPGLVKLLEERTGLNYDDYDYKLSDEPDETDLRSEKG